MVQHIAICGEQGVGKSTLVRRLLDSLEKPVPLYGFLTKKEPSSENGSGVYIYSPSVPESRRHMDPANRVGISAHGCAFQKHPEVFDSIGTDLLRQRKADGLILMDELGFLENEALRFQREVLTCLDGPVPVLCTVKTKNTPFLTAVRSHPNVRVFNIDPENRDRLFEEVLPLFLSLFQ